MAAFKGPPRGHLQGVQPLRQLPFQGGPQPAAYPPPTMQRPEHISVTWRPGPQALNYSKHLCFPTSLPGRLVVFIP